MMSVAKGEEEDTFKRECMRALDFIVFCEMKHNLEDETEGRLEGRIKESGEEET